MLKKKLIICSFIFSVMFISFPAFATDYSSMTTDELSALRGTMMNADTEDKAAFRTEWKERVNTMSREERKEYNNGSGYKHKARARVKNMAKRQACDGTGMSTGNRVANGQNERGQGRGGNGNR